MIWDKTSRRALRWILRWRIAALALALLVPALVAAAVARAQPGPLFVSVVAIQDDGKIVATGFRDLGDGNLAFAVARYNQDGRPDATFGVGGIVTTDFGTGQDVVRGLVIQSDAKIVVAGQSGLGGPGGRFALARYNPDGRLDSSFGSGGKVETSFGGSFDGASDVAIQEDGKIVAAGLHDELEFGGVEIAEWALARYNPDGSLDATFGSGGKVTTRLASGSASSLAIQRDGKIVAAGVSGRLSAGQFALVRYETDASLDTSFGTGGAVETFFSPGDFQSARAVAIQHGGRIIAAGVREDFALNSDYALARYTIEGNLDTHFGEGGKVATDFGGREGIAAIAVQRNGRIVAAGTVIARYDHKGDIDSSFGIGGKVDRSAESIAIQHDGKIVAVGGTELARLNRDGSLDPSFGDGGVAPTS